MEFDLENPLTTIQDLHFDTDIVSLFSIENEHMPSQNYLLNLRTNGLDLTIRREAISLIFQYSYDPFLSYLAVNYVDRFLSSQGILQAKPWILSLLGVTCVSLAAKMMKTECSVFSVFQCNHEGFIFDTQTEERMELLILGALKWRMRSITPFSFIQFFISLFILKDPAFTQALRDRAIEIIFKCQNEIEILEFRPSIIAASALLLGSHELFPLQFPCFSSAISNCSYVNKENLLKCYSTMEDIEKDDYENMLNTNSSSNTPVNVLDRHYSSSESQKKTTTTTTTTTTTSTVAKIRVQERDMKRRRLSELGTNNPFQLSQI